MPARTGGRGKCAVCADPRQDAINTDLLTLSAPRVVKKYGISKTSLLRHKGNHLSPAVVGVRQKRAVKAIRTAAQKVERMIGLLEDIVYPKRGHSIFNAGQALTAMRELREAIYLHAKITGELNERPQLVVNLQTSQEWIELRSVLIQALAPFPEAMGAVSDKLRVLDGGRAA